MLRILSKLNRKPQLSSSTRIDLYMDLHPGIKTQEAYSVLRTLHALNGIFIVEALIDYLWSVDAENIPTKARQELLEVVGMKALYPVKGGRSNETRT